MGCCVCSVVVDEQNQPMAILPSESACYPVPFGHVGYTLALPSAMGPLWEFPIEWWYYAGWATDLSGSKKFTILLETMRLNQNTKETLACILYGIGSFPPGSMNPPFITNWSAGVGKFPSPTSTSWSTSLCAVAPIQAEMTCKLTSGTLGLSGATYQLDMTDTTNNVSASLSLKDTFGMILEGASGAFRKTGGGDSFEFAMPSLSILEGSTLSLNGETTRLGRGNLWLDRQTEGRSSSGLGQRFLHAAQPGLGDSKPLYTGNWLGVTMNDQTQYVIVFFWKPKVKPEKQWIVGTELEPAIYPTKKIGLEYPALPTSWDGHAPVQGVNVLESSDFDLNIWNPKDPRSSPHWTSPAGITYCSSWRLRIRDKVYKMTVLVPGSEVKCVEQGFFEGAATITLPESDIQEVGHAFVEQMGYN